MLIIPFLYSILISPSLLSLPRFYKPIFGAFTTVKAMADRHCRHYGGRSELVILPKVTVNFMWTRSIK